MIPNYSNRTLSDAEFAIKVYREYENARIWNEKNWKRCVENWRIYWGNDNERGLGQWPADVAADMIRQGRQVPTFNLCRPTVDSIAGGIMKAPFGFDFSPVDSAVSTLTYRIKDIQYVEKELMDWRSHELEMVTGGLTYQSTMEMYISHEYDKNFGNIGLRTLMPGSVIFDPNWRDPRSKACRKAWKETYLTPLQMIEIYKDKANDIIRAAVANKKGIDAIKNWADLEFKQGTEYGDNMGIIPYADDDDIWGSQYKVVEFYHVEKICVKYDYVLTEDGEKIVIPKNLKTPADKIGWLNENVPGWVPDAVFSEETTEDVQYVTAICPGLSYNILLCNGPTKIQCGRLQFFPWSAYRSNGEFGGIIDAIKDMQLSINYLESLLTYKLQVEGGGGAQFADPSMFESEKEFQRYVRERNNPSAVFKLKRGASMKGGVPIIPVTKSAYPAEAMARIDHLIETMWQRISKVSPAYRGESEHSNESGYLYKLKRLQSDIEQYTIHESLRNFWNEVGEGYLNQAIITHGNNIERDFYNPKSKESFTINKHDTVEDENGNVCEVIIDNISKLKEIRHRVVVVESDDSPTRKIEIMQTSSELLQAIDANRKPLMYQQMVNNVVEASDTYNEEVQEQMKADAALEMQVARQELKTRNAQLKVQELQATMVLNGSQQQEQPASGGETPGAGMLPPGARGDNAPQLSGQIPEGAPAAY